MTPNSSNLRTRATGYLWTWLTPEFKWHHDTDVYRTFVAWTVTDIYNNVALRIHPTEIVKCDGIVLNRETGDVQLSCDSYRRLRATTSTQSLTNCMWTPLHDIWPCSWHAVCFFQVECEEIHCANVQTVVTSGCHGMPLHLTLQHRGCTMTWTLSEICLSTIWRSCIVTFWLIYSIVTTSPSRHGSTPRQTHDACMVWCWVSCCPTPCQSRWKNSPKAAATFWHRNGTGSRSWRLLYEHKKYNYWRNDIATSKGCECGHWTHHNDLGETSGSETGDHTADESASFLPIRSRQWARLLRRRCTTSCTSHNLQMDRGNGWRSQLVDWL